MKMIRQHHPGIDMKRMGVSYAPNRCAQQVDVMDEQVVWMAFQQVDREEAATAWYTITAIVRHVRMPRWFVPAITT